MFEVKFYIFSKKHNSTAQPSSTPVTYNCILKEETNILYPVIALNVGVTTNITQYNYVRIEEFNRFYYISSWSFDNAMWYASLEVDVLASWKNQIGASSSYVLRSSYRYNETIPDGLYSTSKSFLLDIEESSDLLPDHTPWASTYTSGYYVIGVISSAQSSGGPISYYALTSEQFQTFKQILLGTTSYAVPDFSALEISENLWKGLFNPFQYVASCKWFPIKTAPSGTYVTSIRYGWWTLNCPAIQMTTLYYDVPTFYITATAHPQAATRGKYLSANPYSKYTLLIPPFGEFDLDGNIIYISAGVTGKIQIGIRVDLISGMGSLIVNCLTTTGAEPILLLYTEAEVGVDVPIVQISNNIVGAVGDIASSISGGILTTATKHPIAGIINASVSGIVNAIDDLVPHSQLKGGYGSIAKYQAVVVKLYCYHYNLIEENNAERGRPLCETVPIMSIPGYIMTAETDIQVAGAYKIEQDKIKSIMDGGFFYE